MTISSELTFAFVSLTCHYKTLLDNHQVQMLAEKARLHNVDAVAKVNLVLLC